VPSMHRAALLLSVKHAAEKFGSRLAIACQISVSSVKIGDIFARSGPRLENFAAFESRSRSRLTNLVSMDSTLSLPEEVSERLWTGMLTKIVSMVVVCSLGGFHYLTRSETMESASLNSPRKLYVLGLSRV